MTNMNKYKVMLVDDESDVASSIINKLKWNDIGYEIPVYASNGIEALEKCEELLPDVIMTDIKMPYMDGLQLAKQVKSLYPNIKLIIFSGFDEFEYAKQAIQLGVQEYILKPIDSDELVSLFSKIHNDLDKELDERTNINKLESYYNESLPLLQESFFASLIEGNIPVDDIDKYLADYQIDLKSPLYTVIVIHTSKSHAPSGISPLLLSVSVKKLAQGINNNGKYFNYLGNICIIYPLIKKEHITILTDDLDYFARLAYGRLKAVVTVGIGSCVNKLSDLPISYQGARQAVSYRVLYGTGKAIYINEIDPLEVNNTVDIQEINLQEVFKAVHINDQDRLIKAINSFIDNNESRMGNMQDYRFFVMDIMTQLYRFARNNQIETSELFNGNEDVYNYASRVEKQDLKEAVIKECLILQRLDNTSRNIVTKSFVTNAINYVNENYMDENLTVDMICHHLGVSSAYFSTVFKKETGTAFVQYLTDVRLNKATQLLMDPNNKTYIVAKKVGYSDPNYFSYVFKKKYKVSPSKYLEKSK